MTHDPLLLALPVPLLDQRPLVVGLAAAREAELDLGPAGRGEVELERDQRHPLAADGAREPVDLALAQQQLAGPTGLVVEAVAAVELGNVGVEQVDLAAHVASVGLADRRPALAQRLHLRAAEYQAGLEALVDEVVVVRASVLGDELPGLLAFRHDPSDEPHGGERRVDPLAAALGDLDQRQAEPRRATSAAAPPALRGRAARLAE